MKTIVLNGYRAWALQIINYVKGKYSDRILFYDSIEAVPKDTKVDYSFYIGWSKIVPKEIVENIYCICLHPSPLPKYRGGSPIQNQIINGEEQSAVTFFKMDKGIDTGPIISQKSFSLNGTLSGIFDLITFWGYVSICDILEKIMAEEELELKQQNESQATYFKRRKPEMSEITKEEIKKSTAKQIYDKIRCLQEPYPLPYIVCGDGEKLYILGAKLEQEL